MGRVAVEEFEDGAAEASELVRARARDLARHVEPDPAIVVREDEGDLGAGALLIAGGESRAYADSSWQKRSGCRHCPSIGSALMRKSP